jgi:hypothetical protein
MVACTQREYGPPGHGVASESDGESTSSRTSLRFYSQPLRLTLEAQPKGCHSIASTRSRCGSHSKPHALPASHRPLDHTASCPHPMKAKKEDHIASAGKAKKEFSASRYVQHLRLYSIARSAMYSISARHLRLYSISARHLRLYTHGQSVHSRLGIFACMACGMRPPRQAACNKSLLACGIFCLVDPCCRSSNKC